MKPLETENNEPQILLPQTVVQRRPPSNLNQSDLELFRHELEKTIPEVTLLKVRDVRISADGILFKGRKILPESFPFLRYDWKTRSAVKFLGRSYLLDRTRRIDQEAIWITDTWSAGYFHWLGDVLPKIWATRDLLSDRVLLLPHAYEEYEFVRSSLKAFEVQNVEFIAPHEVVRCRRLLLPTPIAPSGHFREEVICGVRQQLLEYFSGPSTAAARRVYISRARAPKRRIANEAEVRAALGKFDFEIIHAEDVSFAEQVRLLSQTRYLVSNHGAGLTNMLFLQSGGGVLELRHKTDRVNNCYFALASALNLNYFYQTCDPVPDGEDAHTADLLVDIEQLGKNLEELTRHSQ
jgi:capsular polysaccharide biosynthesis protein